MRMSKPKLKLANMATVRAVAGRIGATPRDTGRPWRRMRESWLRMHPLCETCKAEGRITAATEVDHRLALADGGKNDESNLASICTPCHQAKTAAENSKRDSYR